MQKFELSLAEACILLGLAVVVACLVAGIGGIVRYTTRAEGSKISVFWLVRLGIFAGIPFGIIGVTSGYMTGLSRVGAISALVPAVLTLMGGVGVYLFGKGGKAAVSAAFAIINFAVMMLTGSLIGGYERVETENSLTSVEHAEQEIEKEFLINRYRRSLGLEECGSYAVNSTNLAGCSFGKPEAEH